MIVCLCGSTKFKPEFEQINRQLTLDGHIVLAPGCFGHYDKLTISEEQKIMLDKLHFDKINMSDMIYVVNPGNYIGSSTLKEIEYAKQKGKKISYVYES